MDPIHAILLAAGVSRRLRGTIDDRPKCLLEFGGRTLLDRHLSYLAHYGVSRVTVVLGYRASQVEALLPSPIAPRLNPRFEEGSILSLRVGLEAVAEGESVLAMDADVLYEPDILGRLIEAGDGFCLDETSGETGEEMMLGARGGRVHTIARSVGTDWDEVGEGVGFFLCPAGRVPNLRATIDETIERGGPRQEYESALDTFVSAHPAPYRRVGDLNWSEIDFPEDIVRAAREILPAVERRERTLGLQGADTC